MRIMVVRIYSVRMKNSTDHLNKTSSSEEKRQGTERQIYYLKLTTEEET